MTVENLKADFQSHHVEGYAIAAMKAGKDGRFQAPLISHITGNLYVGGCIDGVSLGDEFSHVFSMYKWEAYKVGPNTKVHTVTMYDSSDMVPQEQIEEIADEVVAALKEGGKVLVHCQAGLNRSNLISAMALIRGFHMSPEAAIALLREKRSPVVLCNQTFENFLLNYEI